MNLPFTLFYRPHRAAHSTRQTFGSMCRCFTWVIKVDSRGIKHDAALSTAWALEWGCAHLLTSRHSPSRPPSAPSHNRQQQKMWLTTSKSTTQEPTNYRPDRRRRRRRRRENSVRLRIPQLLYAMPLCQTEGEKRYMRKATWRIVMPCVQVFFKPTRSTACASILLFSFTFVVCRWLREKKGNESRYFSISSWGLENNRVQLELVISTSCVVCVFSIVKSSATLFIKH